MPRFVKRGSLLSLVARVAWLKRRVLGWFAALVLLLVLQLVRCVGCRDGGEPDLRVATFNIENYPKSAGQRVAALDVIRETGAIAVGVQEITDTDTFEKTARDRLGASWRFVGADHPTQRVGVLYDSAALDLVSTRSYSETEVYPGAKPTFEARLRLGAGRIVRLIVVHLKAGGDGGEVRAKQLRALSPIARAAVQSGERVVLAGDFNATGPEDVEAIATLATDVGLRFESKDLACSSYWNRRDGCLGVTLDHVLTSDRATVHAGAACQTEGCQMKASCPAYREQVSDHCPVTIDL